MIKIGTNFYLQTKNKELIEKYAPYSYELTDTPDWGYKFHVVKTSCGWLPLFQGHENGINSVKEYKEAYDTSEFNIYDEYGTEYNWEEFDKRVLQWNGGKLGVQEPEPVENKGGDPYIPDYLPISHIPGNKQSYKYKFPQDAKGHFVDEEGYEFESVDFS